MTIEIDLLRCNLQEMRDSYKLSLDSDLQQQDMSEKYKRKFLFFYNYISKYTKIDGGQSQKNMDLDFVKVILVQTWYFFVQDYLLENKWLEFFDRIYASLDIEYVSISIEEFRKMLFGNKNDDCSIKKEELKKIDDVIHCLILHKWVKLYEKDGATGIEMPSYMKDIVIDWGRKLYFDSESNLCNYKNMYNNWGKKTELINKENFFNLVKKIMASEWTLSEQVYSVLGEQEQKKIYEINKNKTDICKILTEKIKWDFDDANSMGQFWDDDLLVQIENVLTPWAGAEMICDAMSRNGNLIDEINKLYDCVTEISKQIKDINDYWIKNAEIFRKKNYYKFIEWEDISYVEAVENFCGLFSSFMISWIMASCKYVSDERTGCSRITQEQFDKLLDIMNKAPISLSIGKTYLICEVLSFAKTLLDDKVITEKIMKMDNEIISEEKYERILIESMINGLEDIVQEYLVVKYGSGSREMWLAHNDELSHETEENESLYKSNMDHMLEKIKKSKVGLEEAADDPRAIVPRCFRKMMQYNMKRFTKI